MSQSKPRVIKDYEKLDPEIQEQIKLVYPDGFSDNLITFKNKDGEYVSALPFETDDKYYMVRMTSKEAKRIIMEDDDYDVDGTLKDSVREEYETKYADLDYISDNVAEEEEDDSYPDDEADSAGEDDDDDDDF